MLPFRFQSTLPVWGATQEKHLFRIRVDISIHAPRVGSDFLTRSRSTAAFYFNPRSPCGERLQQAMKAAVLSIYQSTLPVWGATAKMHRFSFASSAKKGFFVRFSKLGAVRRESAEKGGGIFLKKLVRTSRGKYGYLAFAFRESVSLRANRQFYSQSVLFSFHIDSQGNRIAGCPFRGP